MKFMNFLRKIFGHKSTKKQDSQLRYLNVPYREKDIVKRLGAKWDSTQKQWFIPQSMNGTLFKRWLPYSSEDYSSRENLRSNYFYLAQTQEQCFKCHQQTIVNAIVLPEGFESLEDNEDDEEANPTFRSQAYPSILSYVAYISPKALAEIKKSTSDYNLQYSKTISATYFRTKCQYCTFYQGDNYTMSIGNAPFSPVNTYDFEKISFQEISVPISVYAASWSIGYPPLEYCLGDDSANGLLYVRNLARPL